MSKYRVAVDIGGTFTDFVFYESELQSYKTGKVLTTSDNLSEAIIAGLDQEMGSYAQMEFFVHGTTAGLNAFLERKGANVALITTKGFKDVYEIARGNRPELYNIAYRKPTPLIERKDVYVVNERVLADGTVKRELWADSVLEVVESIQKGSYDSVAVCLINAYLNPVHEKMIGVMLKQLLPDKSVSLSHIVAREWREYERTSTTILSAYIAPKVQSYLSALNQSLLQKKFPGTVYIMQSNGGIMTADVAEDSPIQTLLSGPVGGAIGNNAISEKMGFKNLIGIDMGGTSFDVSMIIDGRPDVSTETSLEGFPILTPMVNIYTIGAGGGSIAWLEGSGLRVGPQSAGTQPGPACYGRGGTDPTVTDANVVLGRIDPGHFLGGKMLLSKEKALTAVASIADKLDLNVEQLAEGICDVVNAKMADAIRQLTIQKGIDPREFILVAFGGAGPMHAVFIAEELNITQILVPTAPGAFSAWGMLQSDIRQDAVRTFNAGLNSVSHHEVKETYGEMQKEVDGILLKQDIKEEQTEYVRTADLRYIGQEFTVNVAFDQNTINQASMREIKEKFHLRHDQIYGHSNPSGLVEIVNLRLAGIGKVKKVLKQSTDFMADSLKERTVNKVTFYGKVYDTCVYDRNHLRHGHGFNGPAIVEELSATTVIPPGYIARVDLMENIIIEKES